MSISVAFSSMIRVMFSSSGSGGGSATTAPVMALKTALMPKLRQT